MPAIAIVASISKEELAVWFRKLGIAANKRDVNEAADALAEYLVDVKGYVTGEDMLQVEAGDIEEARTNASLRLTDISIRTVVRYMRNTPLPQETGQYERSPAGSQGDSKATTLTSAGAEQEARSPGGCRPAAAAAAVVTLRPARRRPAAARHLLTHRGR